MTPRLCAIKKEWYKKNDDTTGLVLSEYLALCVFSDSNLFYYTEICEKRVCEISWLSENISTWRHSCSPGRCVSDDCRCGIFQKKTWITPSKAEFLLQMEKFWVSLLRCSMGQYVQRSSNTLMVQVSSGTKKDYKTIWLINSTNLWLPKFYWSHTFGSLPHAALSQETALLCNIIINNHKHFHIIFK